MNKMILPDSFDDIDKYEVASVDLSADYWSPEKEGEKRRMIYVGTEDRLVPDHKDPSKQVELATIVFLYPQDGKSSTVVNASKRLVAVFENNEIEPGTPVQVTYMGKKKNRTNGNMSDNWSVVVLKKKAQ